MVNEPIVPPDLASVLGDDDRVALDTAIGAAQVVKDFIRQAESAGLNVGEQMKQVEEVEKVARGLKNTFFPGQ